MEEQDRRQQRLDAAADPEYWDWTWAQMGLYDDTANISAIKAAAGVDKVFYIGYSQGTIQMFYGLAHLESSFHAENVYKVVQLAPCFVPLLDPNVFNVESANATIMQYQSYGVYAFNGPNWERDLQTICDNFPQEICDYYKTQTGYQGQAVQSEKYWTMNGIVKRFQYFADEWLEGELETDMVPIENIRQVPIAMFTGTEDETCPRATALEYIPRIQSQTTRIDVEGEGHGYFATKANSDWFMEQLTA